MPRVLRVDGQQYRVAIGERRIKRRVKAMARTISRAYRGRTPVMIGVLNGSFLFFADLVRELQIDCEVDFVQLSSYDGGMTSGGTVTLIKDVQCRVEGRDVIVVEDIVDSGRSMAFLVEHLRGLNPASVRIVTLLQKASAAGGKVPVDDVGFEIPDVFVVGYGLDYAQKKRNLKSIYRLQKRTQRGERREFITRNG